MNSKVNFGSKRLIGSLEQIWANEPAHRLQHSLGHVLYIPSKQQSRPRGSQYREREKILIAKHSSDLRRGKPLLNQLQCSLSCVTLG